ncbi:MAG: YkgJ family cysteine cluster protein [Desulfotalea sp.]
MEKDLFDCQRCGYCCHGETTVSLNSDDLHNMQEHLGISKNEMFDKYLIQTGNVVQMKVSDGHCIFFKEDGCQVHLGRPWRCRQWPMHPAIIIDSINLKSISDSCPGINKDASVEDFVKALKQLACN